jgi:hypothetical protein
MSKKKQVLLFVVIIHVLFGFVMTSRGMSKGLNILMLFVGFMTILATKNKNQESALWSAYVVGSEVLFRMTKGLIFYEFPKYMVFLFLFTGLIIEKKKHAVAPVYLIYILLLLFGITFSQIPYPESIRTNIIFNLSGPILLGLCALYFYKRHVPLDTVLHTIYYLSLPIISMVSYLYFKTPDLEGIMFTANSNFQVSAGFGPNQVATILGLGAFAMMVLLLYRKSISGFLVVDIFLTVYVLYRALLTLSRGGLITALLAMLAFSFYYILSRKNRFKTIVQYGTIFMVFGVSIWLYTSNITGGMLENRYTNKGTDGTVKEDMSTGRMELFLDEWYNFLEHPFFGIGVGSGKFDRLEERGVYLPTHNEMSRLLGEHGLIGVIILMLLIFVPLIQMNRQPPESRGFIAAFLVFWFLTINHSAMRLAMPAFIYGLTVMFIQRGSQITLIKTENS